MTSYYQSQIQDIGHSQTLLINEQSKQLQSKGQNIIRFGFGQSPFSPPEEVVEIFAKNSFKHSYAPVAGITELKTAISKYFYLKKNLNINPENIIVGPGSKILLYIAMASFKQAEVLIPAPSWVSYEPQAKLCGHQIIAIPTSFKDDWKITCETLEKFCQKRQSKEIPLILIMNSPSNPTGMTYTTDELKKICVILESHKVVVISDEIYEELHHQNKHISIKTFYPELTMITSGISKWAGAGGWRLGYIALPEGLGENFKKAYIGIASETYSSVPLSAQDAAIALYDNFEQYGSYLVHQRKILNLIGNYISTQLRAIGVAVADPQGGFYLFPDFTTIANKKGISTSQQFCTDLLKNTGVALLPGSAFLVEDNIIATRLAYVDFDGNKALNASYQIPIEQAFELKFLQNYCPNIIEGICRIKKFFE